MITSPIGIDRLESIAVRMLCKVGLRPADAKAVAWVYRVMTLRGQGHHDVGSLPELLEELADGTHKVRPRIRTVAARGAVAVMEGDNAPGPLGAYRMTEKAIEKAARYGVALVVLRNSNHFLGAAPYALLAAQKGMLGIVASNTSLSMGSGRSKGLVIGNNPWGFAAETGAGFPLLLDICDAYASYGKLYQYKGRGWKIPRGWGLDARGRPTTDPARVIDGGVPLPIGEHKGFGLAVLVELLTGVLSGGAITDEVSLRPTKGDGSCQAALVIDLRHFMPLGEFRSRTRRMVRRLKGHPLLDPRRPTLLPGERSHESLRQMTRRGVRLSRRTVAALNQWAERLRIKV